MNILKNLYFEAVCPETPGGATDGCTCGAAIEICSSGQTCIPTGGTNNDGACAGTYNKTTLTNF